MGVIIMYSVYRILDGESLDSIANKFNTTIEELEDMNGLDIEEMSRASEIIVPETSKKYFEYYKVQKGDSMYGIARRYNINPELLASLNGLNYSDYIYPDQLIMIPKSNYSYYITKEGDTLDSTANVLGVSRDKLLNENKIVYLLEGQLLVKEAR